MAVVYVYCAILVMVGDIESSGQVYRVHARQQWGNLLALAVEFLRQVLLQAGIGLQSVDFNDVVRVVEVIVDKEPG